MTDPGGALFVPTQGAGRFDNPAEYDILYAADTPEGAVAEAFGRHPIWTPSMLAGIPALPGSAHALATIDLQNDTELCDLDDARQLVALQMRPSQVVSRDYTVTQATAARIFSSQNVAGIRWWSYYNPAWVNVGIWKTAARRRTTVEPLSITHVAVLTAARAIVRMIQS